MAAPRDHQLERVVPSGSEHSWKPEDGGVSRWTSCTWVFEIFKKRCKHHDFSHFSVPNHLDGQRLPCQLFGEATRTAHEVDHCRLHLHCAKAFLKWVTSHPNHCTGWANVGSAVILILSSVMPQLKLHRTFRTSNLDLQTFSGCDSLP